MSDATNGGNAVAVIRMLTESLQVLSIKHPMARKSIARHRDDIRWLRTEIRMNGGDDMSDKLLLDAELALWSAWDAALRLEP